MGDVMEQHISRQQVNELRLVAFTVVNDWYSRMGWGANLGDREDVLLENCSPKKVRCVVWKFFEKRFQTKDGCLDLPKSKYGEAKRFLRGIELDTVRTWALMQGFIEVLPEKRPSGEQIRHRQVRGINANRAKHGYPPLPWRPRAQI